MKVVIAFDRDPKKIGKTVDVPDAEAVVLVREGRARYADPDTEIPAEHQAPTVAPVLPEIAEPIPAPTGEAPAPPKPRRRTVDPVEVPAP